MIYPNPPPTAGGPPLWAPDPVTCITTDVLQSTTAADSAGATSAVAQNQFPAATQQRFGGVPMVWAGRAAGADGQSVSRAASARRINFAGSLNSLSTAPPAVVSVPSAASRTAAAPTNASGRIAHHSTNGASGGGAAPMADLLMSPPPAQQSTTFSARRVAPSWARPLVAAELANDRRSAGGPPPPSRTVPLMMTAGSIYSAPLPDRGGNAQQRTTVSPGGPFVYHSHIPASQPGTGDLAAPTLSPLIRSTNTGLPPPAQQLPPVAAPLTAPHTAQSLSSGGISLHPQTAIASGSMSRTVYQTPIPPFRPPIASLSSAGWTSTTQPLTKSTTKTGETAFHSSSQGQQHHFPPAGRQLLTTPAPEGLHGGALSMYDSSKAATTTLIHQQDNSGATPPPADAGSASQQPAASAYQADGRSNPLKSGDFSQNATGASRRPLDLPRFQRVYDNTNFRAFSPCEPPPPSTAGSVPPRSADGIPYLPGGAVAPPASATGTAELSAAPRGLALVLRQPLHSGVLSMAPPDESARKSPDKDVATMVGGEGVMTAHSHIHTQQQIPRRPLGTPMSSPSNFGEDSMRTAATAAFQGTMVAESRGLDLDMITRDLRHSLKRSLAELTSKVSALQKRIDSQKHQQQDGEPRDFPAEVSAVVSESNSLSDEDLRELKLLRRCLLHTALRSQRRLQRVFDICRLHGVHDDDHPKAGSPGDDTQQHRPHRRTRITELEDSKSRHDGGLLSERADGLFNFRERPTHPRAGDTSAEGSLIRQGAAGTERGVRGDSLHRRRAGDLHDVLKRLFDNVDGLASSTRKLRTKITATPSGAPPGSVEGDASAGEANEDVGAAAEGIDVTAHHLANQTERSSSELPAGKDSSKLLKSEEESLIIRISKEVSDVHRGLADLRDRMKPKRRIDESEDHRPDHHHPDYRIKRRKDPDTRGSADQAQSSRGIGNSGNASARQRDDQSTQEAVHVHHHHHLHHETAAGSEQPAANGGAETPGEWRLPLRVKSSKRGSNERKKHRRRKNGSPPTAVRENSQEDSNVKTARRLKEGGEEAAFDDGGEWRTVVRGGGHDSRESRRAIKKALNQFAERQLQPALKEVVVQSLEKTGEDKIEEVRDMLATELRLMIKEDMAHIMDPELTAAYVEEVVRKIVKKELLPEISARLEAARSSGALSGTRAVGLVVASEEGSSEEPPPQQMLPISEMTTLMREALVAEVLPELRSMLVGKASTHHADSTSRNGNANAAAVDDGRTVNRAAPNDFTVAELAEAKVVDRIVEEATKIMQGARAGGATDTGAMETLKVLATQLGQLPGELQNLLDVYRVNSREDFASTCAQLLEVLHERQKEAAMHVAALLQSKEQYGADDLPDNDSSDDSEDEASGDPAGELFFCGRVPSEGGPTDSMEGMIQLTEGGTAGPVRRRNKSGSGTKGNKKSNNVAVDDVLRSVKGDIAEEANRLEETQRRMEERQEKHLEYVARICQDMADEVDRSVGRRIEGLQSMMSQLASLAALASPPAARTTVSSSEVAAVIGSEGSSAETTAGTTEEDGQGAAGDSVEGERGAAMGTALERGLRTISTDIENLSREVTQLKTTLGDEMKRLSPLHASEKIVGTFGTYDAAGGLPWGRRGPGGEVIEDGECSSLSVSDARVGNVISARSDAPTGRSTVGWPGLQDEVGQAAHAEFAQYLNDFGGGARDRSPAAVVEGGRSLMASDVAAPQRSNTSSKTTATGAVMEGMLEECIGIFDNLKELEEEYKILSSGADVAAAADGGGTATPPSGDAGGVEQPPALSAVLASHLATPSRNV